MHQSVFDKSEPATKSILTTHQSEARLATAEHISLDDTSLALISQFLTNSNPIDITAITDNINTAKAENYEKKHPEVQREIEKSSAEIQKSSAKSRNPAQNLKIHSEIQKSMLNPEIQMKSRKPNEIQLISKSRTLTRPVSDPSVQLSRGFVMPCRGLLFCFVITMSLD